MTDIEKFEQITKEMLALHKEKNKNYGNSFTKTLDEDGLIVSKIRLRDKLNRFASLLNLNSNGTKDESVRDTLIDLANYAVMTIVWIETQIDNNDEKNRSKNNY